MAKLLVITGASRGLGLCIAKHALEAGYAVMGMARSASEAHGFPLCACDVTDSGAVSSFFARLRGSRVWGMVNAAGCASMNLHLATPPATMKKIVECNLLGTMYCCAEAGKLMARQKRGRIINFSSIAVALGLQGESAYVAAKAGIEAFSKSFAREMAHFGVTVNVIAPGPVETDLIRGVPQEKIASLRKRQVLPVSLQPDDIWKVVSLLLEESCSILSGETIHVGGV